jgi:hypothetical protein
MRSGIEGIWGLARFDATRLCVTHQKHVFSMIYGAFNGKTVLRFWKTHRDGVGETDVEGLSGQEGAEVKADRGRL